MRHALILGGFVTFVAAACSSSDALDATSFNQQYCDLVAGSCCPAAGKTYNQSTCVTQLADASNANANYNAAAASGCLDAIRTARASATFCSDFGNDDPAVDDACNSVYSAATPGTKNPGDQCDVDDDCAATTAGTVQCVPYVLNDAQTNVCILEQRAASGAACAGDRTADTASLFANLSQTTVGICWKVDGLYCDSTSNTCLARGTIGQPCAGTEELACVDGAHCDLGTKTCEGRVAVGGACNGVADECATGSYCDATQKTCTTSLALGSACATDDPCGEGASCASGKCAVDPGLATALLCAD